MKHTKKLAMTLAPLVVMAIFMCTAAHAYTFTSDFSKGFYWQSFPIQMSKFVTDPNDGATLEALTNQAAAEWENASGKNLWDISPVQTTSNYSGNYIRWSDNFGAETGYDPSKTLAITIRYNQGTFFQQTVIILNGNISYLRQNWGNSLKTTILHEIGHTLGLDHSGNNSAIMAATLTNSTSLQPDDIQGVNALVDETIRRQSTGYISPYSAQGSEKKSLMAACGTVEDINGKGPKNGTTNFLGSLMVGFAAIAFLSLKKKQSISVRY